MQHISTHKQQLIPDDMAAFKLKQLQYETDTWKRLLGFIIEENIMLKNRLSEILKEGFDKNLLEELENFQSRFIKEDELNDLLRNEVAELDKLLVREIFEDNTIAKEIEKKLNRLRNNIITAEKQFSDLKLGFNSYLAENI